MLRKLDNTFVTVEAKLKGRSEEEKAVSALKTAVAILEVHEEVGRGLMLKGLERMVKAKKEEGEQA